MKKTIDVLRELDISYSTLYRIRRKLNMFSVSKRQKRIYSQKDIELIKDELRKENSCHIS